MNITRQRNSLEHATARLKVFTEQRQLLMIVLKFGVVFAFFYVNAVHKLDPDFGWHLQSGNYYRMHGFVSHDIFTYTAVGHSWYNHEWGNDVIVSFMYGIGGYSLLAFLYATLWTGSLALSGLRIRFSVLFVAMLAILPFAGIRAIAWTVPCVVIAQLLLRSKRPYAVWYLPLLFLIWANLHGGFTIGLALVAYTILYEKRWRLVPVLIVCALVTLVNPFGWKLYIEITETLLDRSLHSQISEWAPFTFTRATIPFIVLWGASSVLALRLSIRNWTRPTVVFMLAAISAQRNIPVFVAASVRETNDFITKSINALPKTLKRSQKMVVYSGCAAAVLAVLYITWSVYWPINTNLEASYPVVAVTYLQTHGCEGGHVFNDYNFGGYLIWKLPNQKVFIDGRLPIWRDPSGQLYLTKYYSLLRNPAQYNATFSRYNIRCSLLQRSSANDKMVAELTAHGWKTAVQTPTYILQIAP